MDDKKMEALEVRSVEINNRISSLLARATMAILVEKTKISPSENLIEELEMIKLKTVNLQKKKTERLEELLEEAEEIEPERDMTLDEEKKLIKQLFDLFDKNENDLTALEKQTDDLLSIK